MFDSLTEAIFAAIKKLTKKKENKYRLAVVLDLIFIFFVIFTTLQSTPFSKLVSPLSSITVSKNRSSEVFGFAPFWTFQNLDKVDFSTLTTFAYFGITVNSDGTLLKDDPGYSTFESDKATVIFKKAHSFGTRVVLTLTQMDASSITSLMDDSKAQEKAINDSIALVKSRGIDGINVDFEYGSNPGDEYRKKFTTFINNFTTQLHQQVPGSKLTVSVYASAMKDPKIYDIKELGKITDGIFMMAYDFAVAGSDNAIPTSPLYGYKQGKYWYDVSTAVEDFLTVMPANKLILGLPWYGYNYSVYTPTVDAQTTWYGGQAQMYGAATNSITPANPQISNYKTGWDSVGQVGYKAYYSAYSGTWRMIFLDDPKSLGIKYDFAKSKNLAGVGIWALGFEDGNKEMWAMLRNKFGNGIADSRSATSL